MWKNRSSSRRKKVGNERYNFRCPKGEIFGAKSFEECQLRLLCIYEWFSVIQTRKFVVLQVVVDVIKLNWNNCLPRTRIEYTKTLAWYQERVQSFSYRTRIFFSSFALNILGFLRTISEKFTITNGRRTWDGSQIWKVSGFFLFSFFSIFVSIFLSYFLSLFFKKSKIAKKAIFFQNQRRPEILVFFSTLILSFSLFHRYEDRISCERVYITYLEKKILQNFRQKKLKKTTVKKSQEKRFSVIFTRVNIVIYFYCSM